MIDPEIIRNNPDKMKTLLKKGRGDSDKVDVDRWLELDQKRSELIQEVESLRQERNELNAGIQGRPSKEVIEKGRELKEKISKVEEELDEVKNEWQEILDWMPNLPISKEAMPEGKGEEDNIVVKAWRPDNKYIDEAEGKNARGFTESMMPSGVIHAEEQDFEPKHHLDIGTELGIIDNEQAAKVAGSRFTYLKGDLVKLQYAVQQLMFNELLKRDFIPFIPPLLVKDKALYGTSHFPEGRDQVYSIQTDYVEEKTQLYLLGSTEPGNFAYFMDRVIEEDKLPFKLFAYAPAFRSEAGSWGKDTKGIKRMHQFDKIEMNCICTPEQSEEVFNEFLSINEWLLQSLGLPYQLAQKCTGDAGYLASAMQIDPEVWCPGQNAFMEVMTDTNATDYQARRLNIKYRDEDKNLRLVHTVNDTGVAMGRILISILENYQQKDGSVKVPIALQDFMGKEYIKKREKIIFD